MRKYSAQEIAKPSWPVYKVQIAGLKRFFLTLGGADLCSPLVERIKGVREPETTEIFKAGVGPGDVVLEGGACYGYMTMQLSQLVGEHGKVVSAEPDPRYRKLLQWNLQKNNIPNVTTMDWFLTAGEVFKTDAAIAGKPVTLSRALKLAEIEPDFIFMDIEGYEVPLLWKALSDGLFNSRRPVIVFQPHYSMYNKKFPPESFEKLWKAMTVFGYSMHRLEYLIVCLPKEPEHAKQAAIRKLLHGGLRRASVGTKKEANGTGETLQDREEAGHGVVEEEHPQEADNHP